MRTSRDCLMTKHSLASHTCRLGFPAPFLLEWWLVAECTYAIPVFEFLVPMRVTKASTTRPCEIMLKFLPIILFPYSSVFD